MKELFKPLYPNKEITYENPYCKVYHYWYYHSDYTLSPEEEKYTESWVLNIKINTAWMKLDCELHYNSREESVSKAKQIYEKHADIIIYSSAIPSSYFVDILNTRCKGKYQID